MTRWSVGPRLVVFVAAAVLTAGMGAWGGEGVAQQRPTTATPPTAPAGATPNFGAQPDANDPFRARVEEKRLASATTERRKRMLEDADKLLQLAGELKEDVDKTTKDEMSVPTIKKAAEIEKLAHDVKERMKGQ